MDVILGQNPGFVTSKPAFHEQGFAETLKERIAGGADWTRHKAAAQELSHALQSVLGYKYSSQVGQCSVAVILQRPVGQVVGFKIRPTFTCKKRWCPVCAWRLSLKRWANFVESLPDLLEQQGRVKWLLLTLTIKNVEVANANSVTAQGDEAASDELANSIKSMIAGVRKLTKHKDWPAVGWIRAVEITFPRDGEAHPHIHMLLAVKPSYFSTGYISQAEWSAKWKKAMKLDYEPIVDIRKVKPMAGVENMTTDLSEALGGLREVSKYCVKPVELGQNPGVAVVALNTLKKVRMLEGGGFLRGVFTEKENDLDDLPAMEAVATYWWRANEKQYRRKLT